MKTIEEVKSTPKTVIKKLELLVPAGSLEKLKIAVHYGADAVFLGGQEYGLRSDADNFTMEEIAEGVELVNCCGAKTYITANIAAYDENTEGLESYLRNLEKIGVTGIIVADPLIIETRKRVAPRLEIHLSTQQSLSNYRAIEYWKEEGLDRAVLARGAGTMEMRKMEEKAGIEIRVLTHGAMCIAYSDRYTLSNHMITRDFNGGGCRQSRRWDRELLEVDDNDELDVFYNQGKAIPFATGLKDLELIESIPQMMNVDVGSLEIEGRMKLIHYTVTVVSVYRRAIDAYAASPDNFKIGPEWSIELGKYADRDTAPAFLEGTPGYEERMFGQQQSRRSPFDFCGLVLDYNEDTKIATIQQRNNSRPDQEIKSFGPEIETFTQVVEVIYDEGGNSLNAAHHPLQVVRTKVDRPIYPNNTMRKEIG